MRYREGETPGEIGAPVDMDFTGVGIFGSLLGVGFDALKNRDQRRAHQRMLATTGVSLSIVVAPGRFSRRHSP